MATEQKIWLRKVGSSVERTTTSSDMRKLHPNQGWRSAKSHDAAKRMAEKMRKQK